MMRMVPVSLAVSTLLVVAEPGGTDEAPVPFDTHGFLTACTSRVPNVDFIVPMNQRCVSTARDLCNLSLGAQGLGRCLGVVTEWLKGDNARIRIEVPEVQTRFEVLSQANVSRFGLAPPKPCTEARVAGVSTEMTCAYQETLTTWLGFRILELSDHEAGE